MQNITYKTSILSHTYNLSYSKVQAEEAKLKVSLGNLKNEGNSFARILSTQGRVFITAQLAMNVRCIYPTFLLLATGC